MSESIPVQVRRARERRRRILDALYRGGQLTREEMTSLLEKESPGAPVDVELQTLGRFSAREITAVLAKISGFPPVDLAEAVLDPALAAAIPSELANEHTILPIGWSGPALQVAVCDPSDLPAEDAVRRVVRVPVSFVMAAESQVLRGIRQLYGATFEVATELDQMAMLDIGHVDLPDGSSLSAPELERMASQLSTVRIANQILGAAAWRSASDIHIEPQATNVQVRLREEGHLLNFVTLPKSIQPSLAARIKVLGNMDISNTRQPQDGRCRISINGRTIDLRISSLPTAFGETIVIRILEQSALPITLETLHLSASQMAQLARMLDHPQGLLLVTGPTGSGKSTTLYAAVSHLKQENTNIITVEDPVERQIPGVNQVAINERAGITFATALRAMLRQDPNVIMVGEIRDHETAEIAITAGLTGHLVLSTLHTNDAASTITRLLDMGVQGHLLSPALLGVVAQRLVRRLCPECGGRTNAGGEHPRGCPECQYTGFKGRIGLFEILEVTPPIAALISRGATAEEIRGAAVSQGMRLLTDDAEEKIAAGIITTEEASAVVDLQPAHTPAPPTATAAPAAPTVPPAPPVTPTAVTDAPGQAAREIPLEPKILVVEDCDITRTLLVGVLESNLYKVVTAQNGIEGVKKAAAEAPDLIIADVLMPMMDGFEMVKRIRSNTRTRHIPVIMLTGENQDEDEARGLEVGADDYIQKPFRPKSLLARIHLALNRNRG